MINRRDFIGVSTLAVAGGACGVAGNASQARSSSGDGKALPNAIAALTSMRDQVTPITVDERKARLEKARRLMTENKLNAMLLTGGTSMDYFTGMRWGVSERLTGVVIPRSGNAFIVTPKFEEERTLEQA